MRKYIFGNIWPFMGDNIIPLNLCPFFMCHNFEILKHKEPYLDLTSTVEMDQPAKNHFFCMQPFGVFAFWFPFQEEANWTTLMELFQTSLDTIVQRCLPLEIAVSWRSFFEYFCLQRIGLFFFALPLFRRLHHHLDGTYTSP